MITFLKEEEKYFAVGRRSDGMDMKVEIEQATYDEAQTIIESHKTEDEQRVHDLIEKAIAPVRAQVKMVREENEVLKETIQGLFLLAKTDDIEPWRIGVEYHVIGELVQHEGAVYYVSLPHTSTEHYKPGTETGKPMYTYIGDISEEGSIDDYPEWEPGQSYPIGFRAYYQGKLYEVVMGNADGMNTWAPDAYGWEEVTV